MTLSIVIPTRGRAATLERTLTAIASRLPEADAVEVLVIEDGEGHGSAGAPALPVGLDVRYDGLPAPARGPAAARNLGIRRAGGERVLLLGDDTAPAPGCLAAHARARQGLQGRIDWDPARPISDVMRFLAPRGPQFWFDGLLDGAEVPFTAVLGSNYSAPRAWFLAEPFDESFPHAAFEDTELAWRFRQRGYVSRYASAALALHDHPYDSLAPFLERQRRAGRSARRAVALHPALFWWAFLRPLAVHVVKSIVPGRGVEPELGWDRAARHAYLAGFVRSSGPASSRAAAEAR